MINKFFFRIPASTKAGLSVSIGFFVVMLTFSIFFANAAPAVQGNATYTPVDASASSNSSLRMTFNENLNDINGVISCPGGVPGGSICYDPAGKITLTGNGWIAATGDINLMYRLSNSNPQFLNQLFIGFNRQNAINLTGNNPSITLNNFGGIVSPQQFSIVAAVNNVLEATYDANLNGVSSVNANMGNPLTTTNSIVCPQGAPGSATCYAITGNIFLTNFANGVSTADVAYMYRQDAEQNNNKLWVKFNGPNKISSFSPTPTIRFNNFGGITQPITFNVIQNQQQQQQQQQNIQFTYNANIGGFSDINGNIGSALTTTNSIVCPQGAPGSATCYGTTGNIFLTNFANGVSTADVAYMYRQDAEQNNNKLWVKFNGPNKVSSFSATPTATFNNFGGITQPITVNIVQNQQQVISQAASGDANYVADLNGADPDGVSKIIAIFTQDLNPTPGNISCPVGAPNGVTCYALSNVTLGGTGAFVDGVTKTFVYKNALNPKQLEILFSQANVIGNFGANPIITVNNIGGINQPIQFAVANPGSGEEVSGIIENFFLFNNTIVEQTFPALGSKVSTNHKVFGLKFSNAMLASSLNATNVTLTRVGAGNVTGLVSYDQNANIMYFTANQGLVAGSSLILGLSNQVKDIAGNVVQFQGNYTVGSSPNNDSLEIVWTNPTLNQSNVNTLIPNISFGFNKQLNPATVISQSLVSTPDINSFITYDPLAQSIVLRSNSNDLQSNTSYQVRLLASQLRDSMGNSMDEDYLFLFSTGAVNNTIPSVLWTDFYKDSFKIAFDLPMKESPLETAGNFTLNCGSSINLTNAKFNYSNTEGNLLEVKGIQTSANEGTSCTLTLNANVQALNDQSLPSEQRTQTGTVKTNVFGQGFFQDISAKVGFEWFNFDNAYEKIYQNPLMQAFNPYKAKPESPQVGVTSSYFFNFPITQALSNGNIIDIIFPNDFDITNASISNNKLNNDINSNGNGIVTFSSISVDRNTHAISLVLNISGASAIGSIGDQLSFKLDNILNTTVSSASGYIVQFKTKDSNNKLIEGPIELSPFVLAETGSGQARVTVRNKTTDAVISGVILSFESPAFGYSEVTTNGSGQGTVSNIAVSSGITNIIASLSPTNIPSGYLTKWSNVNFSLTNSDSNQDKTIYLEPASLTVSGTITHSGVGSDGQTTANIWLSGKDNIQKKVNLDADGSTNFSLVLTSAGVYKVGIDQFFDSKSGGKSGTSFTLPATQSININSGNSPQTVNFSLTAPNKTIIGTVSDIAGNPIPNAIISLSSDHANKVNTFSSSVKTLKDGTYSIAVNAGKYKVDANIQGIAGNSTKIVEVQTTDTTKTVNFSLLKPSISITGTVSDGTNGIEYASVSCFNFNNQFNSTNTDSKGEFIIFVNPGTWTCKAYKNFNEIPVADGVDNTDRNISVNTAGLNFTFDSSNTGLISGIIQDDNGNGVPNARIFAELKDAEGKLAGFLNGIITDSDGSFDLRVTKNTSSQRIKLKMWDSNYGDVMLADDIDIINSDEDLGTITLDGQRTVTLTVNGAPTNLSSIFANIENTDTHAWNWLEIELSNGSGSNTVNLFDGNYKLHTLVLGGGEVKENFVVNAQNTSLNLSLSKFKTNPVTITVIDDLGNPVKDALVDAYNPAKNIYMSTTTNVSGLAILNLDAGRYFLKAGKTGYTSDSSITDANDYEYSLTLSLASSTISGQVIDPDDNAVPYAWVDGRSTNGKWSGVQADGEGNFSLAVNSSTIWNLSARTKSGTFGLENNVSAGTANVIIETDESLDHFVSVDPISNNIDPTSQITVTSAIANFQAAGGVISNDSNGITLDISKTTAIPTTDTMASLGGFGVEIKATSNTDGTSITQFNGSALIEVNIEKEQINALIEGDDNFKLGDLDTSLGFFDETNGTWQVLDGATTFAKVQEDIGDDFVNIDIEDFVSDYEDVYSDYNDVVVVYRANTDHLTIFGPVVEDELDDSATDAPEGLIASLNDGDVVLNWDDNTENDLLEYEIYRSTSSSVAISDADQINSSSVSESTYTDTNVIEGETYYYLVTAIDISGNESSASNTINITVTVPVTDEPIISTNSSSGGGSGNSESIFDFIFGDDDELNETIDSDSEDLDTPSHNSSQDDAQPENENDSYEYYEVPESVDYNGHWAENYIAQLYESKVVSGCNEEGDFCPDANITRAELLKIVMNLYGLEVSDDLPDPFTDIDGHWGEKYIVSAYEAGIVNGYSDHTFKPDANINRSEAMKIVFAAAKIDVKGEKYINPFKDIEEGQWYTDYVLYSYQEGIVKGYDESDGKYFKPGKDISRAEMAKISILVEGLIK